jgi:hypothetical protein
MKYYQCLLCKNIDKETIMVIGWIPEKYAKLGKFLRIKDDDDLWNNGWTVKEVYNSQDAEFVFSHERDFVKFLEVLNEKIHC